MEPPSTVLDDYFSRGIALILILLVYALISGVDYAFRTQNEPSSDKTGGKHLPEALMLFLLLFKIAVIILSSSLLALIYAVPLAFTLMLAAEGAAIHLISGHEKSFLKKCWNKHNFSWQSQARLAWACRLCRRLYQRADL